MVVLSLQIKTQGLERLGSKEIALLVSVDACVQRQDGCLMPNHQKVEDRVSPPPQWKCLWQWLHLLRGSSSCWTCDHSSSFCWVTLAPGLQDQLSSLWPPSLRWQCLPADFWVCSPFSGFWTGTYFLHWILFVLNIGVVSFSWLYTDWHSDWDKTKKKKIQTKNDNDE